MKPRDSTCFNGQKTVGGGTHHENVVHTKCDVTASVK